LNNSLENNETDVIRRLREGDKMAFEILFHRYKNRI